MDAPNAPLPVDQPNSGNSQAQTTSLLGVSGGIGQTDQCDQLQHIPSDTAHTDPQSSAYASETAILADVPIHRAVAGPPNLSQMSAIAYSDPYETYQSGRMFPLGVLRGFFFFCAHLDGLCHHPFEDTEALQTHFESHFSYTRIQNPYRLVCSFCQWINDLPGGPCSYCSREGTMETWVYGHYIQAPTYQRYGPDGHDFLHNNPAALFFPSMGPYEMSNNDFGLGGMDHGNGNFTTGGMNQGGYYSFQNNFGDPSS